MAEITHIFCIPFPGAGHAINMFNMAVTIANENITAHVLVLSNRDGQRWLKATGQEHNPNVHVEVIAKGQWENWHPEEPKELVMHIRSLEFTQAVSEKIQEIRGKFPSEGATAIVYNALMGTMPEVAKIHKLQNYLMNPTAVYVSRLGSQVRPGQDLKAAVVLKGIGGSDLDITAETGDVVDFTGLMFDMTIHTMAVADGMIYSNTNLGLEGESFEQKHLLPPPFDDRAVKYMIGPILPPWYEHALDDTKVRPQSRASASTDECIRFMNEQADKTVVYVGMGSHIELTVEQAEFIIKNLRKHQTPWVLLFREGLEEMKNALGPDISDGVVTPWAPQLDILLHPALKCVLSHGGFGTMIEGIYAGQPFITSPVASDQFIDTRVMRHLGICVGTIAENHYQPIMKRSRLTPFWSDDGGKGIQELLERVFGTSEGEAELDKARTASRALRKRMVDAKAASGAQSLDDLRVAMLS